MTPKRPRWKRLLFSLVRITLAVAVIIAIIGFVIRQPAWNENPLFPGTVDPARLEAHVRFMSVECHPRNFRERINQQKVIDYITARFREAGGRVVVQEFPTRSGPYQNIVAHFGPEGGPRYVVGAHFDSYGTQPGADDNASGVAGLIELAVLLGKEKSLPAHFELVAYNLEEPPFFGGPEMGSAVHARSLQDGKVKMELMLSLEMIGYFSDKRGSQEYPSRLLGLVYPSRADFIAIVGRWDQRDLVGAFKRACVGAADIPVVSIAAPSIVPAIDFSDHRNYWERGMPALMITDTSFLRNKNYHHPTDTADTLDYRRMAEVVRLVNSGLLTYAADRKSAP